MWIWISTEKNILQVRFMSLMALLQINQILYDLLEVDNWSLVTGLDIERFESILLIQKIEKTTFEVILNPKGWKWIFSLIWQDG